MSGYDSYSHYVEAKGRAGGHIYVPPDMEELIFLGTRVGDKPVDLSCGRCGYKGPSEVKKEKGPAYALAAVATLGLARKKALEVHHFCPTCQRGVAYSKPI